MTGMNPTYRRAVAHLSGMLPAGGGGNPAGALFGPGARRAAGVLYGMVGKQAAMLSYLDVFWFMCICSLVVCVPVLLLRRTKPGQARAGGH
jgi:hypothetical protein